MTIPFNVNPGGLFNRIGALGQILKDIRTFNLTTLPPDTTALLNQYETGSNTEFDIVDGIPALQDSARTGLLTYSTGLKNTAALTIQRMVMRDNPVLQTSNTSLALAEVIRQMNVAGQTVQNSVITPTQTPRSVTGTGVVVISTKRGDGRVQENTLVENGLLTCTSDSQSGGATVGNESFRYTGQQAQSNILRWDWPLGSGANITLRSVIGQTTVGNLLANSSFALWTAGVPNKFVLRSGTAGTDFQQNTTVLYLGTSSLQFIGGSGTPSFTQQFNSTSGTTAILKPNTQYALAMWLGCPGGVPAAGQITMELVDPLFNVVSDAQGVANSAAFSVSALSTTFTPVTAVFRTPANVPSPIYFRLRVSVPISSGGNVYASNLAMQTTTPLYVGGPQIAIFAGKTNWLLNDQFVISFASTRQIASFQTLFDQLIGMRLSDTLLPSSASPTIPDSLI